MRILVFGMGFSGLAAARALQASEGLDLHISGTTRSKDKAHVLSLSGIEGLVFDGLNTHAEIETAIASATHIIHSIAPNAQGDAVFDLYAKAMARSKNLQWMCYYSTIGVYGNFDGAWVDETAICTPENKRSQWRVTAEQNWRDFAKAQGLPLTILRLAGIYGPGRSTFDKITTGTSKRIIKEGQVFNRIHVDDIGRVTALAAKAHLNGIFNLADDEPAPPQQVIEHAAQMMGVQPPPAFPYESAEMTPMARSFYADNKRVSNAAIKKALGIELLYPTYREGLAMIGYAQ